MLLLIYREKQWFPVVSVAICLPIVSEVLEERFLKVKTHATSVVLLINGLTYKYVIKLSCGKPNMLVWYEEEKSESV